MGSFRADAIARVLLVAVVATGCRRQTTPAPAPDSENELEIEGEAPPKPADLASADAGAPRAPARCRDERAIAALRASPTTELELGDVASLPGGGVAIGLVRGGAGGRMAAVAIVSEGAERADVVELESVPGDAPPPRLFARENRLYAASFVVARAQTAAAPAKAPASPASVRPRELALFRIGVGVSDAAGAPPGSAEAKARAERITSIHQARDESYASDVAGTDDALIVVWDEDVRNTNAAAPQPARPVVAGRAPGENGRVAGGELGRAVAPRAHGGVFALRVPLTASPGAAAAGPRAVAPTASPVLLSGESDAQSPRIVPKAGGGYVVAWLAERPEGAAPGAPSAEGPGEGRTFRWVELVPLDARGQVQGAPLAVSNLRGHVDAFELLPAPEPDAVDLLAREESEASEGEGGRLLRIRVAGDRIAPRVLGTGVAPGPADALRRMGAFVAVAFRDASDRAHLLPLDPNVAATHGTPSLEPVLDEARPLAVLRSGESATSGGGAGQAPRGADELPRAADAPTETRPELPVVAFFANKPGGELRLLRCRM
jgi:hypothetical protein